MPVVSGLESISFSLIFSPGLNSAVPPPRMIGLTAMRDSAISPCRISWLAKEMFLFGSAHRVR